MIYSDLVGKKMTFYYHKFKNKHLMYVDNFVFSCFQLYEKVALLLTNLGKM